MPSWTRSVEVIEDGAVIRVEPREGARRRGTVSLGTRMRARRRVPGDGCVAGVWIDVGLDAFVCETSVRPSPEPPRGETQPPRSGDRLLPFTYAFVQYDGTRAFARPSDYGADDYVEALGEGFGLVVTGRQTYGGMVFAQTRRGLWVERSNLTFARGSELVGVAVDDAFPLAWAARDRVVLHDRPGGRAVERASRRTVLEVAAPAGAGWLELADGRYVRTRDVAHAQRTARPEGVGPDDRWIDIDVSEQVLVAYQGDQPVYATLVSTGRPQRGVATPIGEHRIWVKLATSDMDDLERTDVERNYAIESVPWVQYFEGANGLHAAFWHDDFGRPRSRGCVNLSPADARFLFEFTRPVLPSGWYAVLPTERDPATLVRVRE
jgi:hypothetical protein